MEEQPTPNALAAAFPNPPPFWQAFSTENIGRVSALRSQQDPTTRGHDPAKCLPVRLLDLPTELRWLEPPEPPADGKFRCFGDFFDMNDPLPSLEEQGIQQLYTPPDTPNGKHADRALVLKRLAKSLLLNFLDLVGILSINPALSESKIADLRTLFINFHHLLNEYRPHQARESLIMLMQDQLDKSRSETRRAKEMSEKVDGILQGLSKIDLVDDTDPEGYREGFDEGREMWDMLEREFGIVEG